MEQLAQWWSTRVLMEQLFWIAAIPSTLLMGILLISSIVGLDGVDGADGGAETDFPLLSVRNLVAFFLLFGWVGIVSVRQGFGGVAASLFGVAAGSISVVIMMVLMKYLRSLATSGNYSSEEAIGKKGIVYVTVPGKMNGFGKITVTFAERQHELKAVTRGDCLETGTMVSVVEMIDNKLVVERIS